MKFVRRFRAWLATPYAIEKLFTLIAIGVLTALMICLAIGALFLFIDLHRQYPHGTADTLSKHSFQKILLGRDRNADAESYQTRATVVYLT